ncbi:MAG: hypothetical protein ACT4OZ_13180 [Gemmatimonadota bacterium]
MTRPLGRRIAPLLGLAFLTAVTATTLGAQRVQLDSVRAGDESVVHSVQLQDGSRLIGLVTRVTADSVTVRAPGGLLTVARSAVVSVSQYSATRMRDGQLWPDSPHTTRLLFSPTATPLRKGEGYFADFWIFLGSAAVGVTDRLTLGVGATLFPFAGTDNLFFLLPKYTVVHRPRGSFAVGGLLGSVGGGGGDRNSLGILYGVGTIGSRESNFTAGAGWGYANGEIADRPMVTLGVLHRTSRGTALVSENWIIPLDSEDAVGLFSLALRLFGERVSVDAGAGIGLGEGGASPLIPLLGFAWKF